MGEEKLIDVVYLNNEVRIRKDNGKYFIETAVGTDTITSREIMINELSSISRKISLMVFEFYNPDHYELTPKGF